MIDLDRAVLYFGIAAVMAVTTFNLVHAHAAQPPATPGLLSDALDDAAAQRPAPAPALPQGYWTNPATSPLQGVGQGLVGAVGTNAPEDSRTDSATPTVASTGQVYALRGDMTAELALDLQAALRAGFRRITITSRGGEVLVARAMADLLNRAGAVLVAESQCHSSCAYLWLATHRHELGRDADLALHATFDKAGPNDFGVFWLREMGRSDLAPWALSSDLHRLSARELRVE